MPIEGLRGLCAGLVVYAHVLAPATALDPRWAPPAFFWWLNLGYAAVLMFFVLSGYVIGLTTSGDASGPAVRRYLLRRFLRLVPMVTAAVLLAWCLVPSIEVRTVLGNLLFLQNSDPYPGGVIFDLMPNNPNLWSLNYEAVYYLAFIALWRWQPRAGLVWTLLGIGMLASSAGWPALALLSHWACGGLYWLAGLAVARRCAPTPGERRSHWPAALLGAYAMWTIAPLRSLLLAAEWYPLFGGTPASPHRIDFLPACVWVLAAVTGRAPQLQRRLAYGCLMWATAGGAFRFFTDTPNAVEYAGLAALTAAWLVHRREGSTALLARLAPLGAVSFGVYVFAIPIQFAQAKLFPDFSGTPFTYTVRLGVVIALVLAVAWLLEVGL